MSCPHPNLHKPRAHGTIHLWQGLDSTPDLPRIRSWQRHTSRSHRRLTRVRCTREAARRPIGAHLHRESPTEMLPFEQRGGYYHNARAAMHGEPRERDDGEDLLAEHSTKAMPLSIGLRAAAYGVDRRSSGAADRRWSGRVLVGCGHRAMARSRHCVAGMPRSGGAREAWGTGEEDATSS